MRFGSIHQHKHPESPGPATPRRASPRCTRVGHQQDNAELDATLVAIAKQGTAVGERTPLGDMGYAAYFTDSEGNLLGLWQTAGSLRFPSALLARPISGRFWRRPP